MMAIRLCNYVRLNAALFSLSLFFGCAASSTPDYNAVLGDTSRPEAERSLDAVRKPNEVMAFYAVKNGDRVADIFASRGYYTAILSQLVGRSGIVYSANLAPRQELHDRAKQPAMANVRIIDGPFEQIALPQDGSLDFVFIHLDYHELPPDARIPMSRRIFNSLKKGGVYGVVDHSAKEGVGDTVAKTLHRMDKNLVIKEATSVGFRLDKEGTMLSRPEDTRDFSVVKERDKSDRFVLKFVKP
jgi:predicted methyltransferase